MSLKMTPSDIASAVLEVASLKTHVHRVTVAGVRGVFGQHYYNWGQSTTSQSHRRLSRGQHWLGLGDWVCCFQHRCRLFILGDRVWSQMRKTNSRGDSRLARHPQRPWLTYPWLILPMTTMHGDEQNRSDCSQAIFQKRKAARNFLGGCWFFGDTYLVLFIPF